MASTTGSNTPTVCGAKMRRAQTKSITNFHTTTNWKQRTFIEPHVTSHGAAYLKLLSAARRDDDAF